MTTLTFENTRSNDDSATLGEPTGDLSLRFAGSSRDGQIVRLGRGKCSIGSSNDCTLRLDARGIHPVHCLILRGARGSVIRRWSADTRLNGRAFRDAVLRDGDRLSIGSVDFDVLVEDNASGEGEVPADESRRISELTARLNSLQEQSRKQSHQYEIDLQAWHDEKSQLQAALDAAQEAEAAAAQRLFNAEEALQQQQDEWQVEQRRREESITDARKQLDEERRTLEAQCVAYQAEHDAAQRQWREMTEALKEAHETFEQERTQWRSRVADRQKELAELELALAETREQLISQTEELDRAKSDLEEERQAYFEGREESALQLEELESELARREDALRDQKRLLQIREAELEKLHDAVQKKHDQLEVEVAQLQNDRKELLAWRGECETEIANRRQDVQNLQEEFETRTKELDEQRERLSAEQQAFEQQCLAEKQNIDASQQELTQRQELITREHAEAEGLRAELDSQREKLEQQQQELAAREENFEEDLNTQRAALEEQSAHLQRQQEELQSRFDEIELAQAELQKQQDDFAQQTAKWDSQRQENTTDSPSDNNKDLQSELEKRAAALQDEATALSELEASLRDREAACNQQDNEVQILLAEIQEREARLINHNEQSETRQEYANDYSQREHDELNARQRYRSEVAAYRAEELAQQRRELEKYSRELIAARAELRQKTEELEALRAQNSVQSTESEWDIDESTNTESALAKQLQQKQEEFARQAENVADLEAELARREQAFDDARQTWQQERKALEDELDSLRATTQDQAAALELLREQKAARTEKIPSSFDEPSESPSLDAGPILSGGLPMAEDLASATYESTDWSDSPGATFDDGGFEDRFSDDDEPTSASVEIVEIVDDEPQPNDSMQTLERLREQMMEEDDDWNDDASEACRPAAASESLPDSDYPVVEDTFDADHSLGGGADGEDVSIEDYMSQLMQRVQGRSEADAPTVMRPAKPAPKKAKPKAKEVGTENESAESPKGKKREQEKLTSLSARATAPEQASNLQAMRELANESARSAITTSSHKQASQAVRGKFAIAIAGAVTGVILIALNSGIFSWGMGTGLLSLGLAGWFTFDGIRSRRRLLAQIGPSSSKKT